MRGLICRAAARVATTPTAPTTSKRSPSKGLASGQALRSCHSGDGPRGAKEAGMQTSSHWRTASLLAGAGHRNDDRAAAGPGRFNGPGPLGSARERSA